MRARRLPSLATLAGLLVVWAVAWSVPPGQIAEDTKNDVLVDPWGFLLRALTLWDSQVTWGGLANQGYGYLFPMGPFFAVGSEVAPMWVVQRLWWGTLLTAGFLGANGLLRALDIGSARVRVVGALSYVLAPRVVSSVAGLSAEAQAQILAPLVVLPLVLADRGRLTYARAALFSGCAVLILGGVNATATLCAIVPAGLWLVTRHRWWASRLTWLAGLSYVAATAWWLVPLFVMGRWSPPFLDWIENAEVVTRQIGMLDVVKGTTHWLGHVVTPGGPWWPAGHELVTSPVLIVLTSAVSALALAGLALRTVPERRWVWAMLVLGFVALTIGHSAPLGSPLTPRAQDALDGPLAPLRNIHKLDLLVRMSLMVGLTTLLARLSAWRPRVMSWRPVSLGAVALIVVAAAAPAFTGAVAVRGTFTAMPQHWVDAGRWLDDQPGEGTALLVPASNFGEYRWGRTIDEPLRALTSSPYAVRDAVPLAPAGSIRLLDEVERRLQSGEPLGGAVDALRRTGVRHLVVRNDLAPGDSGQPPVALARSSVRGTPGIRLTAAFGGSFIDDAGARVRPVEIYELPGQVAAPLEIWPATSVLSASGASEDLARIAEARLLTGPVVFDGDAGSARLAGPRVETDGYRARERWFGAQRGADLSHTLTAEEARVPDYRPWDDDDLVSVVTYGGIKDVSASSSLARHVTFLGLRPAMRPFAALDGDARTAWVTMWDERPSLRVDLARPTTLDEVRVTGLSSTYRLGGQASRPTRLEVATEHGTVQADLEPRTTSVAVPGGESSWVTITILDTVQGPPGESVTGLAEVELPGVSPRELIQTPLPGAATSEPHAVVLGSGLEGRDGCATEGRRFTCFAGESVGAEQPGPMRRVVARSLAGTWSIRGTLEPTETAGESSMVGSPDVTVEVSSSRSETPQGAPQALVDGDDRTAWSPSYDDASPDITLRLAEPQEVTTIRLQVREGWAARVRPVVEIERDEGEVVTRQLGADGTLRVPAATTGTIRLRFTRVLAEDRARHPFASLELEEIRVAGLESTPAVREMTAPCGSGPFLLVDGRTVPTTAAVERDALFGSGEATWAACGEVSIDPGESHTVEIEPWRGFTTRSAVLTRAGAQPPAAYGERVEHDRSGSTWSAAVSARDEERVVVMDQNSNRGWAATLGGQRLEPLVLDGRRQGFVVPAGLAGELRIDYPPGDTYRAGLLVGGVLALGLVGLTVLSLLTGRRLAPAAPRERGVAGHLSHWGLVAAGAILGLLVAGPVGAVVVMLGMVAGRSVGSRSVRLGPLAVALLVLCAGSVQAAVSPGLPGQPALEAMVRVVLLLALGAAAGGTSAAAPRRSA